MDPSDVERGDSEDDDEGLASLGWGGGDELLVNIDRLKPMFFKQVQLANKSRIMFYFSLFAHQLQCFIKRHLVSVD